VEDRSPPTMEELQTVKRIRIGNAVCGSLFLLFLPACLVFNYLFPGKLTVFAVTYIVVIGCVAYPVSFMPCPRCGQTFNMYHPFDREHGWVNDGGGSGGGTAPETDRKIIDEGEEFALSAADAQALLSDLQRKLAADESLKLDVRWTLFKERGDE